MTWRSLSDVGFTDIGEVGGKAASLGELLSADVRVPDGIVLAAGAADMPPEERNSVLRAAAETLGTGPFAVRSSGMAEDGTEHSYAGMYESFLNVPAAELPAATERCLASARSRRSADYGPTGNDRLAVIVQRMITPAAAGVVLSADPVTGDRESCIVSAVRGTGDRLVSGVALGDEWVVRGDEAVARRQPERAIDHGQAIRVAAEAQQIAARRGSPQDVEWAIDADGTLWILQARPMTALPPDVAWDPPAPGAYTRTLRFGEWISEPVTPLFESWLLTRMEDRLHLRLREQIGQHAPRPYHVVVNGWYFYSINFLSGAAVVRSLPDILWHLVRTPRNVAGVFPPTVRHSVPITEREWREELLPRYREAVGTAEGRVDTLPVTELPALVDELADFAGHYFASIAALSGAAYKLEMNLAKFCGRHLAEALDDGHLPLLAGFEVPTAPDHHAVTSLDWWHAPVPAVEATSHVDNHERVVQTRRAAEERAFRALANSPRRLRSFRRLLLDAQHLVRVREEQVRELTIAWPVLRRAVLRIGQFLTEAGVISEPDDVFFLTHDEAAAGVRGSSAPVDVTPRRTAREEQVTLVAPLVIGPLNPVLRKLFESAPQLVGARKSERALVSGSPASPGRATGAVRVIRGPHEFDQLQPGEVLVAPLTAPAWTPLFNRAAAVVTDVGSAASHASIIAREYGIPAIVGCGDATTRLPAGMLVTVDGGTGNVEPGVV